MIDCVSACEERTQSLEMASARVCPHAACIAGCTRPCPGEPKHSIPDIAWMLNCYTGISMSTLGASTGKGGPIREPQSIVVSGMCYVPFLVLRLL